MNDGNCIKKLASIAELPNDELLKTVEELMKFFNTKNKECIECKKSRRRYESAERLAPDGMCWSCLRDYKQGLLIGEDPVDIDDLRRPDDDTKGQ